MTSVQSNTIAPDVAIMAAYSFLLTLLNILIIIAMGVLIAKVKQVAPIPGKSQFWKHDIQVG